MDVICGICGELIAERSDEIGTYGSCACTGWTYVRQDDWKED